MMPKEHGMHKQVTRPTLLFFIIKRSGTKTRPPAGLPGAESEIMPDDHPEKSQKCLTKLFKSHKKPHYWYNR